MLRILVSAFTLALFGSLPVHAGLNLTLAPTADPAVIAYEFSGTTLRTDGSNRNSILNFNSTDSLESDFVDSAFDSKVTVALSGTLTNTATAQITTITGISMTNSPGDDWQILFEGILTGSINDPYTISGSGTFTLSGQTWSNFIIGTNVSSAGTGTFSFGPATLTVVPEPASYVIILSLVTFAVIVHRRRRLAARPTALAAAG
jgi:hypothetical protein